MSCYSFIEDKRKKVVVAKGSKATYFYKDRSYHDNSLVLLSDGNVEKARKTPITASAPLIKFHDALERRGKRAPHVPTRNNKHDNDDSFAPAPLNKGGGDDDFPPAGAAAAETIVSRRKIRQPT